MARCASSCCVPSSPSCSFGSLVGFGFHPKPTHPIIALLGSNAFRVGSLYLRTIASQNPPMSAIIRKRHSTDHTGAHPLLKRPVMPVIALLAGALLTHRGPPTRLPSNLQRRLRRKRVPISRNAACGMANPAAPYPSPAAPIPRLSHCCLGISGCCLEISEATIRARIRI